MKPWVRRLRGALGMGAVWAIGWAVAGVLIGVTSLLTPFLPWERFFEVFDAPLPALAVPGFVGGAIFSLVLGIAARRRRFSELSLPRFAGWGALGGVLLSLVPDAMAMVGLLDRTEGSIDSVLIAPVIVVPLVLLSTVSAAVTLTIARRGERNASVSPGDRAELLDQPSPFAAPTPAERPVAQAQKKL